MFKAIRSFIILLSLLFSLGTVFAAEMPYSDVPANAPYANSVQELYDNKVITDDGSHLFRPTELMARDFFVSLSVGIGCHQCETPPIADIISYRSSPFIDLPKTNRYYYCIAYAADTRIAQGYIPDTTGRATCENREQYTTSPFCASNTITRIEAAAILLRRAKLWDDALNSTNFDRSLSIPDVTTYWYGYARKGIEIGIIEQGSDKKIGQDTKITRGEFAMMAARILRYTQCKITKNNVSIPIDIVIRDISGSIMNKTVFKQGSTDTLSTITNTGSWERRWILVNTTTYEKLNGSNDTYPISSLSCGTWINTVDLIDRSSRQIVSSASNTITIDCSTNTSQMSLDISADPLSANIGKNIVLTSLIQGGSGTISYRWDYGDGYINTASGNTSHAYRDNGAYTVTLIATDASGNVGRSSLVVLITGDRDTDSDTVIDTLDQCPLVYAQTSSGCPGFSPYKMSITNSTGTPSQSSIFSNNACLDKKSKSQGLLIGEPNCTQCPCINTISINAALRSCDIVFPTILSPSLDTVYSRGGFFLIP